MRDRIYLFLLWKVFESRRRIVRYLAALTLDLAPWLSTPARRK